MRSAYLSQCLPFSAFLSEVSLNEIVDDSSSGDFPEELHQTLPDISVDIESDYYRAEMSLRVSDFVSTLSDTERKIIHGYFWQNKSQDDVAAALGISQQAVSYTLSKIYRKGRAFFGVSTH